MTSSLSIYDNEQYLFEIAQSFIRSRVIFTCSHLKLFDHLLLHPQGLTCEEIGKELNLHYLSGESRCLPDVLDALASMKFLERNPSNLTYRLSSWSKDVFLPDEELISKLDEEFYLPIAQCDDSTVDPRSKELIYSLMFKRIEELVDLKPYSHRSVDQVEMGADLIILWRQNRSLKEKIQQAFDVLPSHGKGLLILVLSDDEVTLTLNLFFNLIVDDEVEEEDWPKIFKEIGFETVERLQSSRGDFSILLAYK